MDISSEVDFDYKYAMCEARLINIGSSKNQA